MQNNKTVKQSNNAFMMAFLLKVKKKLKQFGILILLLSSCISKHETFQNDEKEIVTAFLEEFLLEHGGAYTLFGFKPMTHEVLIDFSDEAEQQEQLYIKNHPEIESIEIDRRLEEGWEIWKKRTPSLSKNFILTEIDFKRYRALVFVNVSSTIQRIHEHYADFKKLIGHDFDPVELIQQLREEKQDLWLKVLSDYKLLGILFGYGYKNSSLFEKMMIGKLSWMGKPKPSENTKRTCRIECYLNDKPFRIPIFAMLDELESETLVIRYKKEREWIKSHYQKKDFLDVTLAQLQSSS